MPSLLQLMAQFNLRLKGLWGLVDGSKSEPQLVLTKTIDGKAQELDGVEKEKAMNEYERKWEEWKIGHHKIITWIIACVDTTTMGQIAKHNFAHEAWEFLKKTHTMKDVAYMCNLQMKIASLQQGDKSIKEYVGEMEQLWDELALFEPEWYDPRDIGVREKQIQREKFYKFILGLRSEYDGVKTSLLHRHKVPPMNEAIAELQMEENRLNFSKDKSESVLATSSRPGAHMRTYRPPHFNRNYEHSNNGNKKGFIVGIKKGKEQESSDEDKIRGQQISTGASTIEPSTKLKFRLLHLHCITSTPVTNLFKNRSPQGSKKFRTSIRILDP
ncbi:hypothetical protein EJ110_NYTH07764 [Nymphaea thermarum]|nr:hypothetical protein EJ110_NYTH07764 [Nymphaea thermarum]